MRNRPSRKISNEILTTYSNSFHLVDKSRESCEGVFDEVIANWKLFNQCANDYDDNPNIDNLFQLALAIVPLSENTAISYCEMVLKEYPFHDGANETIAKLTRQKPPH